MGGSIFTSGPDPLYTPRMPRAVYAAVRTQCHDVLRELFWAVASPIDGPGKLDFGDIDVLLALPRDGADAGLVDTVTRRLGAVRSIAAHQDKASMAIPWPDAYRHLVPVDASSVVSASTEAAAESASRRATPYIQVDIDILPSRARFHWALFKHAHGDFWNIVASAVLRPLGFTVDDRALWLRVPEIEHAHRNRAKVFLSDEPAIVLAFLHLAHDNGCWDAPFADAAALFAYCATCRFFALPDAHALADRLKSNDRRRLSYRPLFRQWATEFVPAQWAARTRTASDVPAAAAATRATARDAAFAYFPGAQTRFDEARASWLRERHLLAVRTAAKSAVPSTLPNQYRGDVCTAVRRRLGLVMGDTKADAEKRAAEEAAAAWTVESVAAHVAAEWPRIAAADIPHKHAQYLASVGSDG